MKWILFSWWTCWLFSFASSTLRRQISNGGKNVGDRIETCRFFGNEPIHAKHVTYEACGCLSW